MSDTERFKIPIGIFVMLRKGDTVLLQLRQNCSFNGCWGFVGGHLDGKEQIVSAAVREVKEEIGIDIRPVDLILKTICHSNKGQEYLQFYFECYKWSGKIENKEPDKIKRMDFFDLNMLPDKLMSHIFEVLKAYERNENYIVVDYRDKK